MKRKASALVFIMALLFTTVVGTAFVKDIKAAWQDPTVEIQAPESKTYSTNTIPVNIYAYDPSKAIVSIAYQLDFGASVTVYSYPTTPRMNDFRHMASGNATLNNLSDGPHHLMATATWTWWVGGQSTSFSTVDFTVDTTKLAVSLDSPLNKTYNINQIPLVLRANKTVSWAYSLDGQTNMKLATNTSLTGLSDGNHDLAFTATDTAGNSASQRVYFAVDTTTPAIKLLSLQNREYNSTEIPLTFNVNESVPQIAYSMDGKDNITISGNTTLTGLPYRNHTLTVYATDEAGNTGASETVDFSVAAAFPTALIIAVVIAVVVVAVCLLVYFKVIKR
jgi:hypothetical protein